MHFSTLGKLTISTLALTLGAIGCEMGDKGAAGTSQERGGKVIDRSQDQAIHPDGSATRTRTQVRRAPSGTVVRETQTEKREVVNPADPATADPTQADPGAAQ